MSMLRTIRALCGAALLGAVLLSATGCGPTGGTAAQPPANQAPPTSPAATSPTSPAATPTAPDHGVVDLSVTAGQIVTQGSVGTPPASVIVTVHNGGVPVAGATVTFRVPVAMVLDGPGWAACHVTAQGTTSTVDCPTGPLAAGQSVAVTYGFRIPLGLPDAGTVSVAAAGGAADANPADNTAALHVCTNGCGG